MRSNPTASGVRFARKPIATRSRNHPMSRLLMTLTLLMVLVAFLSAQAPGGTPFRIEKLDPALDDIIAADTKLEILGDRFALTEGPVWVPAAPGSGGYLLFSDN